MNCQPLSPSLSQRQATISNAIFKLHTKASKKQKIVCSVSAFFFIFTKKLKLHFAHKNKQTKILRKVADFLHSETHHHHI